MKPSILGYRIDRVFGHFWRLLTWISYIMVPSLLHSMDSKSLKKLYLFASCGKELQCRRSMRRKIRFIEKEALVQKIRLQIAFPAILFILALVCVLGICVFLVRFIRKRRQQYRTLNLAWILKEIILQVRTINTGMQAH